MPARIYFTTRSGGSSRTPYEFLNLGFHVKDDPEAVRNNRALLAGELGLEPGRLTSPCQRHTAVASVLDDPGQAGSGAFGEESLFDPCDALMTRLKNVPILLHYADCVPVALCGEGGNGSAVAVIHAGRKGLVAGVVENAVLLFTEELGVAPEAAVAAIGAAIGPCCYEVDSQTATEFRERFGPMPATGDNRLDLRLAATGALKAAG
ncbi:MAG: polyphenol oxidase family protein, partial [Actinomycetota bacterium]